MIVACEQALWGTLTVGRKKEGELRTTSLEFEYLHRKSEMQIGGEALVMTSLSLAHVFRCLFTFTLVSASR